MPLSAGTTHPTTAIGPRRHLEGVDGQVAGHPGVDATTCCTQLDASTMDAFVVTR
jgi:hypothetical protein